MNNAVRLLLKRTSANALPVILVRLGIAGVWIEDAEINGTDAVVIVRANDAAVAVSTLKNLGIKVQTEPIG